jgi:peptidoglycan/xylan/chitin deacetylase (PgdA/CDA1 family)
VRYYNKHWLIAKINQLRCYLVRHNNQGSFVLPPNTGYLTIFHDYEANYAVGFGTIEASYKGITALLDVEKKYGIRATYNIVGKLIRDFPDLVTRIILEGHELASHSYNHRIMSDLSTKEMQNDIIQTNMLFKSKGLTLSGFRSPESKWDFRLMNVLMEQGLFWSAEHDNAPFPYVILQKGIKKLVRLPILMDDWKYMSDNLSPEDMLRTLCNQVDTIPAKRPYGAIGFHPWVQGEDHERIRVFDTFLSLLVDRQDLTVVTFGDMYDLFIGQLGGFPITNATKNA